MPDGSITFSTALDNTGLERQLQKTKREIVKQTEGISAQEAKKSPLVTQAQELESRMRAAREEVIKYRNEWAAGTAGADKNQSEAIAQVAKLETEHAGVVAQIDKIDKRLAPAYSKIDGMKVSAGTLEKELALSGKRSLEMGGALSKAGTYMDRISKRLGALMRRVFFFTIILSALRSIREWAWKSIKTNDKAVESLSRLKGSLLTLAQPIMDKVVPAFTVLTDILTGVVDQLANMVAVMFGTTIEASRAAAEALYEETKALDGTGSAAKKASKQLAAFDELNKIGAEDKQSSEKTRPKFEGADAERDSWLKNQLGNVAGMVTAALLLGGITLVAIGAATGNLLAVLSGLLLLGVGLSVGERTGELQKWSDALGLNSVGEFVVLAIILGGIAIVAIGAAMGNILMVIAGLALIGAAIVYAEKSGMVSDWANTLGLSKAASYVTAALLIGGIALIAIGAMTTNILMVIAGLALLSAGVYIGAKSGALRSWADALGLDSVFDYVVVAIQLAGIALIAIGAAMGNIVMVIAGAALLAAGFAAEAVGEETLKSWWEVLKLTNVQQWVSVALLLVGIALIAIGAVMGNILMVLAGLAMVAFGTVVAAQDGNLKDWVDTLGLQKIVGWVTAVLMLGGMALLVFGIVTANLLMVVAGIGLLGAGIAIGTTSGTFESWVDTLQLSEVPGWVSTALLLGGIALVAIGAATGNIFMVLAGLGMLGAGAVLKGGTSSARGSFGGASGFGGGGSRSIAMQAMPPMPPIPHLAKGAVIPPNREFLAVLGDQKSGTNIEAPLETLVDAFKAAYIEMGAGRQSARSGGDIILQIDGRTLARITNPFFEEENRRVGIKLTST